MPINLSLSISENKKILGKASTCTELKLNSQFSSSIGKRWDSRACWDSYIYLKLFEKNYTCFLKKVVLIISQVTPVNEYFCIKFVSYSYLNFLKKDSFRGIFLGIFGNFSEQISCRTHKNMLLKDLQRMWLGSIVVAFIFVLPSVNWHWYTPGFSSFVVTEYTFPSISWVLRKSSCGFSSVIHRPIMLEIFPSAAHVTCSPCVIRDGGVMMKLIGFTFRRIFDSELPKRILLMND